jgi:DNA excision repair protein ERCC-5
MGVTNLWALLEPCGRRIDIQALRGKRLAIDASGWIFRFIKAMRDEKGELIPNAHLIGFFRRICKLLYHNIRPVFVFDGSTPLLKKQTVAQRRRRRERQEAKVKKVAEKLLLNKLKQHLVTSAPTQPVARKDSENDGGNLTSQLPPREMQEESTKDQEQSDKGIENRDEESDEESDAVDIEPFFPEVSETNCRL